MLLLMISIKTFIIESALAKLNSNFNLFEYQKSEIRKMTDHPTK
jgi:hypothetical protein